MNDCYSIFAGQLTCIHEVAGISLGYIPKPFAQAEMQTSCWCCCYRDKVDDVVINLDLEPEERWKEITVKMKPQV
jgi:hypothetical protein